MKVSTPFVGLLCMAASVLAYDPYHYAGYARDVAANQAAWNNYYRQYYGGVADYEHEHQRRDVSDAIGGGSYVYKPSSYDTYNYDSGAIERRTSVLKDRYIQSAKRHGADDSMIDFLKNKVPDIVFEKMNTMDRKYGQAMHRIWNGYVPDMKSLPEGDPNVPFQGGFKPNSQSPSRRDRLISFAEKKGAPPSKIQSLRDKPDSEYDSLKGMSVKDRTIREAEWIGINARQINFFRNDVSQSIWDELNTLKTKKHECHRALRQKSIPSV